MPRGKYAELVEDEAQRAESEPEDETTEDAEAAPPADDDDDETAEAEDVTPDAEPEPPSAEAQLAMVETTIGLYNESMRKIMGADWDGYEPCFLCGGMGALPPDAPLPDPTTIRCPECKGHGVFVTESHAPNHATRQCMTCAGDGFVPRPPEPVATPVYTDAGHQTWSVGGGATFTQPPSNGTTIPPMPVYDPTTNTWRDPATGAPLVPGA